MSPMARITRAFCVLTRIETAVAVSRFGWTQSDSVVIATAWQFPDALVGGLFATLPGAPILLTQPGRLPPVVADAIRRPGATSAAARASSPTEELNIYLIRPQ